MNYNLSRTTNFKLEIPGFEEVNYFIQSTSLPGVSLSPINSEFQHRQGFMPGNKVEFDSISVVFLVDEDYINYEKIFNWICEFSDFEPPVADHFKDIALHGLTNNKTDNVIFTFEGAFPTSLSDIAFDSSSSDPSANMCTVTFSYQKMTIKRLPV